MRLRRARRRKGRALRVGVRLGSAHRRTERALRVVVRLRRELRVRVRVVSSLGGSTGGKRELYRRE
jgi:hypothetical protein